MNRKYKIEQCAVCGHKFAEQADLLNCPKCQTAYDLVNRKVDNSKTAICRSDCKHWHREFICSCTGTGGNYTVAVCEDCGEFLVTTSVGGQGMTVRFALSTKKAVKAAGKYERFLAIEAGEVGERRP